MGVGRVEAKFGKSPHNQRITWNPARAKALRFSGIWLAWFAIMGADSARQTVMR